MYNKLIQQCKNYDPKKVQYPVIAQEKKDGIFGRWCSKSQNFYTRAGNRVQGLEVLISELKGYPDFDGELLIPGLPFFESSGLLRSFKSTPDCKFYVFDMPVPEDTFITRLQDYHELLNDSNLPHIRPISGKFCDSEAIIEEFYWQTLELGAEGIVSKAPYTKYYDGKKWAVQKRVPAKNAECRITGFVEGGKSFEGMLGSFLVDFNGVEVKVGNGSGMTHELRQKVWDNPDKYLGQSLKLEYKGLTARGSMRSPKFLDIRWDI